MLSVNIKKGKDLLKVTLVGLLVCVLIFVIWMTVYFIFFGKSSGYCDRIQDVFQTLGFSATVPTIENVGKVYYYREGYSGNWQVEIFGELSPASLEQLLSRPAELGLSKPSPDYESENELKNYDLNVHFPPVEIADKFKLKVQNKEIISQINDYLLGFSGVLNDCYYRMYILGKSGYFVLVVTRPR